MIKNKGIKAILSLSIFLLCLYQSYGQQAYNAKGAFSSSTGSEIIHQEVDRKAFFIDCAKLEEQEAKNCTDMQVTMLAYKNINYPEAERNSGIEGAVIAKLTINSSGSIIATNILQSVNKKLDEQVIKMIEEMPKWQPALKNEQPVATEVLLPIHFKIEEENPQNLLKLPPPEKVKNTSIYSFPKITISGKGKKMDKIYTANVDRMPLFDGCWSLNIEEQKQCNKEKLLAFVNENVQYPEEAKAKDIEGTVIANFVIDKNGAISSPKIVNSIGGGTDEEVLRIVRALPKWKPAVKDRKTVNFSYNLSVHFKFAKEEKTVTPKSYHTSSNKDLNSTITDDKAFKIVEQMPLFPAIGCKGRSDLRICSNQKLLQFISDHIAYPQSAIDSKISGTIIWSFVVEKDGSLSNHKLLKGIGGGSDEAVRAAIELLPNFIPGSNYGKRVRVEMVLPIKFKIPENATIPQALPLAIFQLNPGKTKKTFDLKFEAEEEPIQVQVTNLEGKVVYEFKQKDFSGYYNQTIDLKKEHPGRYYLTIRQENQFVAKPIDLK